MAMNGTITLVSNRDDGRMTKPTIAKNTTVKEMLFAEMGASVDPDKHRVMINGKTIEGSALSTTNLKNKDFVVISPLNVKGS